MVLWSADLSLKMLNIDDKAKLPKQVDASGYRDEVLYRQATYDYKVLPCFVDMATIVIPGGEIRIERVRKIRKSTFYLGHYSMPHLNGNPEVIQRTIDSKEVILLKIPGRQLAMTNYSGWNRLGMVTNIGLHPESEKSTLLYAQYEDMEQKYGPVELLISVLLHKTDNSAWSDEELQPICKIEPLKKGIPNHLGGMKIKLKNKKEYKVDFRNMDGSSTRE